MDEVRRQCHERLVWNCTLKFPSYKLSSIYNKFTMHKTIGYFSIGFHQSSKKVGVSQIQKTLSVTIWACPKQNEHHLCPKQYENHSKHVHQISFDWRHRWLLVKHCYKKSKVQHLVAQHFFRQTCFTIEHDVTDISNIVCLNEEVLRNKENVSLIKGVSQFSTMFHFVKVDDLWMKKFCEMKEESTVLL